eukprot:scaffold113222_cov43-Prasinocladus_malaysianus.AAC.1
MQVFNSSASHNLVKRGSFIAGSTKAAGIINPSHPMYKAWWMFLTLLAFLNVLQVPYVIAFGRHTAEQLIRNFLVPDFLFILDIVMQFNKLKEVGAGYIYGRLEIAVCYLKLHFWLDLAAAIPLDMYEPSQCTIG